MHGPAKNGAPEAPSRPAGTRQGEILSIFLALLLACAVLLPLLGHRPLADWDEGIYAEVAREMLASGHWLVPHWNGQLWFEKPPLLFWLDALSLKLFGLNAFAARLPSVLAGIATVGVLHGWMHRRIGPLPAWLSTLLLLSAFGFQHVARAGETDALLGLGCLVSLIGLTDVQDGQTNGWWLFWCGFAAALMTKGAASVTLPLTALILLAISPAARPRLARPFWLGLIAFVFLVLPWHLAMYLRFGEPFLQQYLGFHVLGRATHAIEGHSTHPWFYLWVLLVSAPPFALLYPWALAGPFRRGELRLLRAFALFALLELALFTAVQTRLPHYIAPVYPVLSGLTGALLARWLERWRPLRQGVAFGLALTAVALYLLASALTERPRRALHSAHLPNGFTTPDNRESAALLQRTRPKASAVSGPLLVWRGGDVVPLQTDAFYARRLAQQVTLQPPPPNLTRDIYYSSPEPLDEAMAAGQPRLLLVDSSLLPQLPPRYALTPLATGPSQTVAVITPSPQR